MSNEWYVFKDQQRRGPFSWQQLLEQAGIGGLLPGDQVWSEDTSGWVPAREVKGLFAKLPPPPPPPAIYPEAASPPAAVPPPASPGVEQPMSVGAYFITLLLCAIPVVNLVLLLVWAFGSGASVSRKNFARAILIWGLIGGAVWLVIWLVTMLIGLLG